MYYILFDGEHTGKLLIKGGWLDFCSMHQPSMFKGECVVKQKGTLVPQGFTLALGNLDGVWQWMIGLLFQNHTPQCKNHSLRKGEASSSPKEGADPLMVGLFWSDVASTSHLNLSLERGEMSYRRMAVFVYFLHQNWNWLTVLLHGLSAALPPFLHRLQAFKRFSLWLAPDPLG